MAAPQSAKSSRAFLTMTRLIAGLAVATAGTGCAHKLEKQIDAQVAQTPNIDSPAALSRQTDNKIDSDQSLKPEQKAELKQLRQSARAEMDALQNESLKLRSVLVDQLLTKNYRASEVAALKDRIREVEDRKLARAFKAVDDASRILGHDPADAKRREIMRDIMVQPSLM